MRFRFASVLLIAAAMGAQAQDIVSQGDHLAHLQNLRALVQQCADKADACRRDRVGNDERMRIENGTVTVVRYDWLRRSLDVLKDPKAEKRDETVKRVLERLQPEVSPSSAVSEREARKSADAVLHDVEFKAAEPSWFERMWAKIESWYYRHTFLKTASPSTRFWVRLIVEAVLFAIPLLLLILWFVRQVREDRLIPHLERGATGKANSSETEWMREAVRFAAAGEWREAVHALYWHTIVVFEDRRVWAVQRNRTPREYLALLEPGSERRSLLREQTRMLESVWYGHRTATEGDYLRARQLTEELARS